jgi:D-alanyl-D-alanine carboxypeptidase
MIARRTLTLMLAAAVCVAGCTAGSSMGEGNHADRTKQAAVQQALDASIDSAVVGALIVVDDGDKTWQATAGSAVAGHRQPVDPDSIFRIGSITKPFVATMVMQLVNEGRIAVDGSVQQYLPGLLPTGYPRSPCANCSNTPAEYPSSSASWPGLPARSSITASRPMPPRS